MSQHNITFIQKKVALNFQLTKEQLRRQHVALKSRNANKSQYSKSKDAVDMLFWQMDKDEMELDGKPEEMMMKWQNEVFENTSEGLIIMDGKSRKREK